MDRPFSAEGTMRPRHLTGESFFAWDGDILVVNILGKPSAKRDAIHQPLGTQLKISVTASPEGGRATDHMVRFLAPLFGVSVADIEVVFGQTNVNKQLRIHRPKRLPDVFGAIPDTVVHEKLSGAHTTSGNKKRR